MMEKRLTSILWLSLLISLFSGVAGCFDDGSSAADQLALLVPPEEGDRILPDSGEESPDEAAAKLAGACPFGKTCCGMAGCGLFTDLNNDGCCDLGVVE